MRNFIMNHPAILGVAGLVLIAYGMSRPVTTTGLVFVLTVPTGTILILCGITYYNERKRDGGGHRPNRRR